MTIQLIDHIKIFSLQDFISFINKFVIFQICFCWKMLKIKSSYFPNLFFDLFSKFIQNLCLFFKFSFLHFHTQWKKFQFFILFTFFNFSSGFHLKYKRYFALSFVIIVCSKKFYWFNILYSNINSLKLVTLCQISCFKKATKTI